MLDVFFDLLPTGILQGLILGLVALGVFIPFRFLNFPDVTAEGSYPLGGVLYAVCIVGGCSAPVALLGATVGAGLMGVGTALLCLRLRVNTLLAGIILSSMIYSVNLRLMGRPNLSLFDHTTLLTPLIHAPLMQGIFLTLLIILFTTPFYLFLRTEKGLQFRSVGLNALFARRQGISTASYTLLGLFIGNALVGLGGSLIASMQGYADVGMGVGIVIHALAALMIGERIVGGHSLGLQLLGPIVGALAYQQIQGFALAAGLAPSDLKFMTGAVVLAVLFVKRASPSSMHGGMQDGFLR